MNLGPAPGTTLDATVYRDALSVTVSLKLTFIDRLRCLWHGRLTVNTQTATEFIIGKSRDMGTSACVPRIFPRRIEAWSAPESPGSSDPHDKIAAALKRRSP